MLSDSRQGDSINPATDMAGLTGSYGDGPPLAKADDGPRNTSKFAPLRQCFAGGKPSGQDALWACRVNKHARRLGLGLALAAALGYAPVHGSEANAGLPSAARQAAAFMGRMQKQDGLFQYEFDFIPAAFSEDDHLVRQAGAAYGLAEYLLFSKDNETVGVLTKALTAFERLSIPIQDGRMISFDGTPTQARTGATALALLAEMQYHRATGDERYKALRQAWRQALLAMHRPGAGFRKAPDSERESPYYNGETWLALAAYDHWHPGNPEVGRVLAEVDDYLIGQNRREPDTAFFHWGAMAAAMRHRATGDGKFARFAVQQGDLFIHKLRPRVYPGSNTCYSVEGLLAVQQVMVSGGADEALRQRIRQRVKAEMIKNQEYQIRPGQNRIYFGPNRYLQVGDLSFFAGAYLNGRHRPSTRIDFTQHCLSATVKYLRHLEQEDA